MSKDTGAREWEGRRVSQAVKLGPPRHCISHARPGRVAPPSALYLQTYLKPTKNLVFKESTPGRKRTRAPSSAEQKSLRVYLAAGGRHTLLPKTHSLARASPG